MMLLSTSSFFGGDPTTYVIVPLIAIVAGVVALLRSDRTLLRQDNEDLRHGREDDEIENKKLKEQLLQCTTEKAALAAENTFLRSLNSGQPKWEDVSAGLEKHNELVEGRWSFEDQQFGAFKKVLDAILEVLLEGKPRLARGSTDGSEDV